MWSGDKAFVQNLDQRAGAGFAAGDRELYTLARTLRKASKEGAICLGLRVVQLASASR